MGRLFGTDGVRGVANRDLTPELAFNLGRAGALVLADMAGAGEPGRRPAVLVGRDTRASGDMLEAALAAGICSAGFDVLLAGVVPTPGVAFLTRHYGTVAGAVISASHNPAEDNGIKFFQGDGFKLPDAVEDDIAVLVERAMGGAEWGAGGGALVGAVRAAAAGRRPVGGDVGRIRLLPEAAEVYGGYLAKIGPAARGLGVVLDCANGAAWQVGPMVFERLGAKVARLNIAPDGVNINVNCGSTHPEMMASAVAAYGADVGFAFDGDADRVIAADENGEIVDGDEIMAILALERLREGRLPGGTLVTTVMSNLGLDLAIRAAGGRTVRTKVGDRYVLETMLAEGYGLGGEQSGHIISLAHNSTGDGLLTAIELVRVMVRTGKPLSELKKVLIKLPQVLINVKVSDKETAMSRAGVEQAVARAKAALGDRGRVVVRASGTEPLVRVLVEAEDAAMARELATDIAGALEGKGNVLGDNGVRL